MEFSVKILELNSIIYKGKTQIFFLGVKKILIVSKKRQHIAMCRNLLFYMECKMGCYFAKGNYLNFRFTQQILQVIFKRLIKIKLFKTL